MLDATTVEGFVTSLLQRKFDSATSIPACHKEWWELVCSESKQVAIAAPRNHAKSTSITFSWLLAAVLFRQYRYVMLVSDTESQAVLFLGDIKQELLENEDLIELFGVSKFIKYSETDIIVQMEDGHQFRIIAKGSEQQVRGRKWNNLRPDLIVCDDLENDDVCANSDRREKFRRWFYGALMPSRSKTGKIVVIGTILHMDSLLERLMPKPGGKYSEETELKIVNTNPKSAWKSVKYRAHNEDFSEILWSDRHPKESLMEIREDYKEKGLLDVYSQEYLNYPIDETNSYFKRDDFLPITTQPETLIYYAAADFAVTTKARSDFTAIAIVGVDEFGLLYLVDMRRGRWDSLAIVEEMFAVQQRYNPELFIVEQGVIFNSIQPYLDADMVKRNLYIKTYPLSPTQDKMVRGRSIQARMRAGGVRFNKDAEWYLSFEDEMLKFPRALHDDQVDAFAWIGKALDIMATAPSKNELADEEYDDMISSYYEPEGMSPITGY